jgi:flagellin-specific chaperone FliS
MQQYEGIEEVLEELGYQGNREELYDDTESLKRFLRELDRDERRELKRYIEDLYDYSDDQYIEMKNRNNT